MAITTYTYAITVTENDRVVIPTLAREILDDTTWGTSKLVQVYEAGTDIKVETDPALSGAEQTELDTVVGNHEGYYIKTDPEPGGVNANSIDAPSAPTVTPIGTPGSTTWGYKVTAVTDSGETLASAEQTTTSGPATLGVSDYIQVSWPKVDGAVGYNVYRTTAGGTPSSTGFILQVGRETFLIEDKGRSASGSEPTFDSSGIVEDEPGLIGLGSALTTDPSSPNEGDFWYNATDEVLRFRDGAATRDLAPANEVYWARDGSGHIYAKTATDDIYIGGATPNAVLFDDGDAVFGGSAMVGTERLLVVGSQLIDQDGNAVGLDIDSEATGSPLINLQPINGNSRGDIAFGATRTSDPSAPVEGDFWYQSTDNGIHWYDGSVVRSVDGIWGTEFDQDEDEGLDSTTSTTYQQKLRLSVTGLPAGTYRIAWTYGWAGSAANRSCKYRVQVDDTTDLFEQVSEPKDPGSDQNYPASGFRHVALSSGDHDIDLDYGVVTGGTAYIRNARIEIWRVV